MNKNHSTNIPNIDWTENNIIPIIRSHPLNDLFIKYNQEKKEKSEYMNSKLKLHIENDYDITVSRSRGQIGIIISDFMTKHQFILNTYSKKEILDHLDHYCYLVLDYYIDPYHTQGAIERLNQYKSDIRQIVRNIKISQILK